MLKGREGLSPPFPTGEICLFRFVFTLTQDTETTQASSFIRVRLRLNFYLIGLPPFPQPNSRTPEVYYQMPRVTLSILIQILPGFFEITSNS